jgi:hypothetical protein
VRPCKQEIFDIDDSFCAAHGGQQLAFWNAHHDECGFASMHIYHVASDIRNQACALETYARLAQNVEAERRACEIRLRSERKAGQILQALATCRT